MPPPRPHRIEIQVDKLHRDMQDGREWWPPASIGREILNALLVKEFHARLGLRGASTSLVS